MLSYNDRQHINLRYKVQDTKDCAINNQQPAAICFKWSLGQSISNQSYKTLSFLGRTNRSLIPTDAG
jgi:hypothetical protein